MTREEIIKAVQDHDSGQVKFAVTDIDGILRGKTISKEKFLKSLDDGIGFCNVVFGWGANDTTYNNKNVTGWHTGYPDSRATVDLFSFRKIPWNDNKLLFLGDLRNDDNLSEVCPCTLLKKISDECNDLGYQAKFSSEYEWFNFCETPQSFKEKNYQSPIPPGRTSASLETRVPGADINPYLAMTAALASGLYGIKKELSLDISPMQGNEYEQDGNQTLPKNTQRCRRRHEIIRFAKGAVW